MILVKKISLKKIYKVKQRKEQGKENWSPKRRKPHKMTDDMKKQLKRMALFKNPPTQDRMAEILGVSVATVNRTLFDKLQLRVRKKKKVQQLSEAQIKNRRERAPGFKQVVDENKEIILTTDEAYFSVQLGHNGQREIHYVSARKQGESISQENVKFIERRKIRS